MRQRPKQGFKAQAVGGSMQQRKLRGQSVHESSRLGGVVEVLAVEQRFAGDVGAGG
jgi:hypothetical protein